MPTLTIDGREITVEPNTRVIDAAEGAGVHIPRFCYHKGLSVAANCRMCLVEIEGAPKLSPSCHETCRDGMVVKTDTSRVLEARRAVLEYILLNHPVDCPICDQAGECELQDQYFEHDHQPSRHAFHKKHKAKAKVIGPHVILDAERCINCTRCVRFSEEVAKNPQLTQVQRGEDTFIDVFPGMELDHPYSMCVTDLCPVGALTVREFRFKARSWFLEGFDTVCGECSRGCSIRVDVFKGKVQRIVPRENLNVNQYWACDAGRLAFSRFEDGRVESCSINGAEEADYAKAIRGAVEALSGVKGTIGVVLSPFMTNEDAFAVITLVKSIDPNARFTVGGRGMGNQDDILIRADKNPNRAGLKAVLGGLGVNAVGLAELTGSAGGLGALLVFGADHGNEGAIVSALSSVAFSIAFVERDTAIAAAAKRVFPTVSPYEADGTWLNEFKVLQRVRPAVSAPRMAKQPFMIMADLAERLGKELPARKADGLFSALAAGVPGLGGKNLGDVGKFGLALGTEGVR